MKKIILLLFVMIGMSFSLHAEESWLKAYKMAIHMKDQNTGKWHDWSEWKPCDVDVKIDFDNDIVVVYSEKIQTYRITETIDQFDDKKGGTQIKFKIVDQDNDRGEMRFRKEKDGVLQIYVDFADVTWVYCLRGE